MSRRAHVQPALGPRRLPWRAGGGCWKWRWCVRVLVCMCVCASMPIHTQYNNNYKSILIKTCILTQARARRPTADPRCCCCTRAVHCTRSMSSNVLREAPSKSSKTARLALRQRASKTERMIYTYAYVNAYTNTHTHVSTHTLTLYTVKYVKTQNTHTHTYRLKTGGVVWEAAHCLVDLMWRVGPEGKSSNLHRGL